MSSVVGLELPNAWRTAQLQDPTFDISADQLNITANREMHIPTGIIDWSGGTIGDRPLHTECLDPVSAQDLATKNYVDVNGGNLWSTFDAQQDVDYVSSFKNINLIEPTNPQDSATKNYVDTNVKSDLDSLDDVIITTPALDEFIQFNGSEWVNTTFSPATPTSIAQGNSSVEVIDSGIGLVNITVDGVVRGFFDPNNFNVSVPMTLNSQQIKSLGTPSDDSDATTKAYVDTEVANKTSALDDLTDVTITSPAVNQSLVFNGSLWVNQLLTKSQLPTEIAYEDEVNNFTSQQIFTAGAQLGADQNLDFQSGQGINIDSMEYNELSVNPSDPILTKSIFFLGDGSDFFSDDPVFEVLIDRGGVIETKPVVTSETVFALREFTNGMFTDETGVKLITDGGIGILVQIFNENQIGQPFEVVLDGQLRQIQDPDTSPSISNSISLSVGTDIAPTTHRVWIELVLGVPTMMSSTVSFPSTGDFAVVGKFLLQSQASVLADGAYAVNAPDNEIFDEAIRGHLAHINDRLTELDSSYVSGIDITVVPSVGGGTAGNVTYTSTAGRAFELHEEDIESFDITSGIALVENEGTQTTDEVTRVNDIGLALVGLTCADGLTVIGTNQTINVVVFTIHQDAEPNTTNYGINLPFSVYTGGGQQADAIADLSNFAISSIPLGARGISLLIAEVVISITGAGATFEVIAVKDLRGQIPGAVSSGGGVGGGVSQLNDLSDVTIVSPLIDQIIVNDGAGQWINQTNPAGLLAANNVWLGYQDRTAIADPGNSGDVNVGRFFLEVVDANNTGVFTYVQRNGQQTKVRIV